MKPLIAMAITLLSTFAPLSHGDEPAVRVIFPAYQNPVGPGGPLMWSSLIAAGNNPGFELQVIFNPASGPGMSTEGNYFNAMGTGAIQQLKATNAVIHGYVSTQFGNRNIQLVKDDVTAYGVLYPGIIDGIFLDEVDNDLATVGYYQELRGFIAGMLPNAPVIGNPGQTQISNPSGQTEFDAADYLAAFDTIISLENFGDFYFNGYLQLDIPLDLDESKIGHIVHTQSTWEPSFLELAVTRGAGFLYFTDDIFDPGKSAVQPYDMLPGYWNQFIADIGALNSRSGFFTPGNLNGDQIVNLLDVAPFIALVVSSEYRLQADINCDGIVNLLDVAPFVQILTGP